jgi:hypothetical protein
MLRALRSFALLLCSCVFLACQAPVPTSDQLANADYGAAIDQVRAQQLALEWCQRRLKDPSSAQYSWGQVGRSWVRDSIVTGGELIFGYRLEATINAKNSFGGYIGARAYWFVFRDGQLVAVFGQDTLRSGVHSMEVMARLE